MKKEKERLREEQKRKKHSLDASDSVGFDRPRTASGAESLISASLSLSDFLLLRPPSHIVELQFSGPFSGGSDQTKAQCEKSCSHIHVCF